MGSEDVLTKYFDEVFTEADFVKKTYNALKKFGFTDENYSKRQEKKSD